MVVGIVIAVVIVVGVPVVWKFTENSRRMAKLLDNNKVATELAESVAGMDFDEVGYLFEIQSPNRIQAAFIKIVTNLKLYKAYMPATLFAAQDDRNPVQTTRQLLQLRIKDIRQITERR